MTDTIKTALHFILRLTVLSVPVFFLRQAKDCFILPKWFLLQTLACAALIFVFAAFIFKRIKITGNPLRFSNATGLLVVFTVMSTIAAILSPTRNLALSNLAPTWALLVLYFCAFLTLKKQTALTSLGAAIRLSVFSVSAYAFLQYAGFDFFEWNKHSDIRTKAISTFGNPQLMAIYLAGVLPFIFADFLSKLKNGLKHYALPFACLTIGIGALYISHTRSATLACLVGCAVPAGVFMRKHPKIGKRILGVFALCALTAAAFSIYTLTKPVYTSTKTTQYNPLQTETIRGRIFTWARTIDIIRSSPLWGTGAGTFAFQYPVQVERSFSKNPETILMQPAFLAQRRIRAHNDFLQIAAENGLPAAGIFLLFCLALLWGIFTRFKTKKQSGIIIYSGLAGATTAYVFIMLFHFVVFNPAAACMFFIFAGATTAGNTQYLSFLTPPPERPSPKRILAAEAGAIISVLIFIRLVLPPFASDIMVRKGHSMLLKNDLQQSQHAFEKAINLNPSNGQAFVGLGINLAKQNKPQYALQAYKHALKTLMAENIYYAMGSTMLKQGNNQQAEIYLEKALRMNPFFADARLNLAVLQAKEGKMEEARNTFKTAASVSKNPYVRIVAYTNLGILETKMENHRRALYYWQYARELNRNNNNMDKHLEEKISNTLIEFF